MNYNFWTNQSTADVRLHVHAHFGMCLFYLGDLISLYELMLSICTQSCQQYAFGYVRLCVLCVRVLEGGRRGGLQSPQAE